MFGNIASLFGYVLNFLYNTVNNYGFAIILFTLIFRIILIPFSYKQQKTAKKQAKLQGEINKLQVKYQSDPAQLNAAMKELYAREKISPFSGCLTGIAQFIIFISVFYLVSQPITYMTKTANKPYYTEAQIQEIESAQNNVEENVVEENNNQEVVENNENVEQQENTENKEEDKKEIDKNITVMQYYINKIKEEEPNERAAYQEIKVIRKYGESDERVRLNMDWMGLNLSDIPMQNKTNWKVFIIPVLYVVTIFINTKLMNNMTKKNKEKQKEDKTEKEIIEVEDKDGKKKKVETQEEQLEDMQGMTKGLNYMMPIMSVSIALIAPLGLSLYWLTGNIFMLAERGILEIVFKAQEKGEQNG